MVAVTAPGFDLGQHLGHTCVVKSVAECVGTRERVLSLLLELGPSTAVTLGERLGLTTAGIRRHLDALLVDGSVTIREPRRRVVTRGRPARLYALTDAGHAAGPSGYDDLAVSALRFMSPEQVDAFAQARARAIEERHSDVRTAVDRPAALATALSDEGYAASITEQGLGVQLCQHHCPVQHVAAEFPQLCDAETAALGRLLDVHVQRLATIAHGDGVCTTFIPLAGQGRHTGKATS
ncbi:MAG: transcriptional regulator, ArsR family [Frankiales bacterium]|nr:transcriptional regulator, ArsR family [Frankiales bacterium]